MPGAADIGDFEVRYPAAQVGHTVIVDNIAFHPPHQQGRDPVGPVRRVEQRQHVAGIGAGVGHHPLIPVPAVAAIVAQPQVLVQA